MFGPFETKRLLIRRLEPGDAELLYGYRHLDNVKKYQSWNHYTLMDAKRMIGFEQLGYFNGQRGNTNIGVVLKETNQLIGDIYIGVRYGIPHRATIGYTFNPEYWHQGYARESVGKIIDVLIHEYDKDTINAFVMPENEASIHLLLSLGFKQKGYDEAFGDIEFEYQAKK